MTKRPAPHWPVRFGPEWWALYAARFNALWGGHVESHGFDAADQMRSCHAESAAACADRGVIAFREGCRGGGYHAHLDGPEATARLAMTDADQIARLTAERDEARAQLAALVEAATALVQHIDEALDPECADRACEMAEDIDGGWNHDPECRVERLARALSSLADAARAHDERMRAEGDAAGYARGVEDAVRVCEACAAQMASAPKPAEAPSLFDVVEGGYVHYTRPAGDPLLDEARARRGYTVVPHPYSPPVDRALLREVADRVQQRCVARAEHHRRCDHIDCCDPACPVLAIVKVHDQIDAIITDVLAARGAR